MTFNDKITDCVNNFSTIDKPDYPENKLNLYADFIELISLFSNTDGVSFGDVFDRFFGTKNYSDNEGKSAEQRDTDEIFINNVMIIIEERVSVFGDSYPFLFRDSQLLVLKDNIAWKHKLYLSLLVSSKLNIFKKFRSDLTTEFETLSFFVLKSFLPPGSVIKEFGKNTSYRGNAKQKISELALDLGLDIEDDELAGISERNNQERGLDIIGWIPFEDNCRCKLIYLAQCACGKDAESKQHDTRRFENYLKFYKTKPQHIMFIPYSLINSRNKKFYHSDLIEKEFLVFERKRILSLFNEEHSFSELSMTKIINGLIASHQDIV